MGETEKPRTPSPETKRTRKCAQTEGQEPEPQYRAVTTGQLEVC